jgi:hypothetical protein
MLKLIIIRIIERSRIKTKKMVKHGSPIHAIWGVIEEKIGIKGKTSQIYKLKTKMKEMKMFEILINSIRSIIKEKIYIWRQFCKN